MSEIFVSYSSADKKKARIFVEAFKKHGCSVWWDDELPIGSKFRKKIKEELDSASCVVVLWSRHSSESDPVFDEASGAQKRGVLFPVLIDNIAPPFMFGGAQAAKLFGWRGDEANPEFRKLLKDLGQRLGRPLPPAALPPAPREPRKLRPLYWGALLVVLLSLVLLSALWLSRRGTRGNGSAPAGRAASKADPTSMKVKMDVRNAKLLGVLRNCAKQVGASAATGSNLNADQPISITIDAPLKEVMNELCTAYDCTWELFAGHPPLLFVDSKSKPSPQTAGSASAPPTPAPSAGRRP